MEFDILEQRLTLLPEKAIFWQNRDVLILADVHLGKAGHFRKSGIPVSDLVHSRDIYIIEKLINLLQPQEVIFLGDLFHSEHNQGWDVFKRWIKSKAPLRFRLILGNHDIMLPKDHYASNLTLCEELELDPFCLTHIPQETSLYNIAGHVHPAVRLSGKGRQSLKLPCFWFSQKGAVLPAFGQFTGTAKIPIKKEDSLFVIAEGKVFKV